MLQWRNTHLAKGRPGSAKVWLAMNARNPLRADPTRTTMIRRQWEREMARRFRKLTKALTDFMVVKDALALREKTSLIVMAQEREFEFRTDEGKLKAFQEWFEKQMEADILSVPAGTDPTKPWTAKYVESAYKRGMLNAYLSSREADLFEDAIGEMTQEQFLKSSFGQPETMNKVRLLGTRAFEDLKDVNASMGTKLRRILAQGMIDGEGPASLAKTMREEIRSISRRRALMIARTETIYAHAEGQLDAFEALGVDDVGVKAEWSTAGDDRVCPQCLAREGKVYTVAKAHGLIPLHPNCRCAWIPALDIHIPKKRR